jgi:predicted nucleic acid-binding protein
MIIVDTSVWVSLFVRSDSNHDKAKKIFLSIRHNEVVVFDYIYAESLNVLRSKFDEENCNIFITFVNELDDSIRFSDPAITRLATEYFFQFKKLSFTDCLILASAKVNDYEIATFDTELMKAAKIALAQ